MNPAQCQREITGVLTRLLETLTNHWSADLSTGWREVPDVRGAPRHPLDLWSTAQAIETVCRSVAFLDSLGESISPDLHPAVNRAIGSGVKVLLDASEREAGLNRAVGSGSPKRPSVMSLVWQLRAISAALVSASRTDLTTGKEALFQLGEAILQELFDLQDTRGGWSSFGGPGRSAYVTAMASWAICDAACVFGCSPSFRPHKVHGTYAAVEWLSALRVEGGGIPYFEGGTRPSASRTGLASVAIDARRSLRTSEPTNDQALAMNTGWLIRSQLKSGGWVDEPEADESTSVEVCSYALLGTLKGGCTARHPTAAAGATWLLAKLRDDAGVTGWGTDSLGSVARIWTTSCAALVLGEYALLCLEPEATHVPCVLRISPRVLFVPPSGRGTLQARARVMGEYRGWALLSATEPGSIVEIDSTAVLQLARQRGASIFDVVQTRAGIAKLRVSLLSFDGSRSASCSVLVVAANRLGRTIFGAASNLRVLVSSFAASSAVYMFATRGSEITREAVLNASFIVLGTFVIIAVFGLLRYMSTED